MDLRLSDHPLDRRIAHLQHVAAAKAHQPAKIPEAGASSVGSAIQLVASADNPQGLKMAAAAARAGGLRTREQLEIFHDAITGRNITDFQELVDIAKDIKETGGY